MDQNATRFARFRDTGDISALGRVFDDLAPRLLSLALHFCGDSADAEDVLQETFLVAMQRAESYDPSRPLPPWFAGLLHNVARNHRRSAVRRRAGELPRSSELPSAREIDPSGQAEREELVALLRTRIGLGKYRVLVATPGLDAREVGRVDVADGGAHDLGPLTLAKPARLDIEFTHADGRPWTGDHPRIGVFDAAAKRVNTHIDTRVGAIELSLVVPTDRPASYKVELSGVDVVAGTQQVELAPGTRAHLRFAVTIAHSREITFNYDGKDPFKDKRAMHVEVRDAAGALVCERELVAEHRHLHVHNYWCLRHTFADGRYTVFGRASNGTTYRGAFTVGANLDEPTRIEVPVGG